MQSWRYFHPKLAQRLRTEEFRVNESAIAQAQKIMGSLRKRRKLAVREFVGIHVRSLSPNEKLIGPIQRLPTNEEFQRGIRRIREDIRLAKRGSRKRQSTGRKRIMYVVISSMFRIDFEQRYEFPPLEDDIAIRYMEDVELRAWGVRR